MPDGCLNHEWRLAERYNNELTQETHYVFYCIHCLKLKKRIKQDFKEED